jgi:hypothetical protein
VVAGSGGAEQSGSTSTEQTGETQDVARIVCKERPEIAACLDGLVFRGQEEATSLLLRAALVNVAGRILGDFQHEESIPAFVGDLQVQAMRLVLAGKALERELQVQNNPQASSHPRAWGYSAEISELLHHSLPPVELSQEERKIVARRAKVFLESEVQAEDDGGEQRIAELQALLQDTGDEGKGGSSCLIVRLPRARFAEWLARWVEAATAEAPQSAEVPLLRNIAERLLGQARPQRGMSVQKSSPIIPRTLM